MIFDNRLLFRQIQNYAFLRGDIVNCWNFSSLYPPHLSLLIQNRQVLIIRLLTFWCGCPDLYISSIPQHYSLWGTFIYWSDIFGIYPLIWEFSGVLGSCIVMKSPTQTNGECENHKEMLFIQGRPQSSRFYLYIGSERSAFQCAPILLARWQNVG